MKISVVVPVYNAERSIRGTLESVAAQTLSEWECVCVDDGSTDGSAAILDEYAAKDPRIRVIHKPNGGEGSARNAGMDAATGDIIAFLDADDRMHPEALGLFCAMHGKTGFEMLRYEARFVSSPAEEFAPLGGEPVCERVDFARCGESPFKFCALGWATVVTRDLARQMRWTDLKQGADMVFVMDCLLRTKSTFRTRAKLVNYYMDPNSISRKLSLGLLKGTCEYLPAILSRADQLGVTDGMRDAGESLARDMLLRRLPGAWKLLGEPGDRRQAEAAYWKSLRTLSARPSFCRGVSRAAVALAAWRESLTLLRLLVVLPYRLARKVLPASRGADRRVAMFSNVYDRVFPLGQWCAPTFCLKELGLRSASTPFDWMMGKGRSIGDYARLLADGFAGFFLKENMRKVREDPDEGTEHWKDESLGWEIRHEFRIGVPFEANYENFHAMVGRRAERMLKAMRSGGRTLFVHWAGEGRYPRQDVVAAVRRLRAAFPETQIDALVMETEKFARGVSYDEPEPGVVIATGDFYDPARYDAVRGNRELAVSVLRRIRMRGRWKNILRLKAESFRRRLGRRRGGER